MAREEKTRLGRAPTQVETPRSGGVRQEPATSGRAPTQLEMPRSGGSGLDFSQDGLETGGEARPGRTREGKSSGVFESPRGREGSRSTGERPRLETRGQQGARKEGSRSTGERPRLETRGQEGAERGTRLDKPPSPRTGERPRLPTQRAAEAPRQTEVQVPVPTPGGPEVHEGAEARPLEELLPTFSESIGEESLAHHFAEELRFLGAELRPSRMAPSERAERLWSFFLAYAEANAKDPAGQTKEGRELFHEALKEHGFAGLREAHTGRDGVAVALELLEAQSPEELHEKLAGVRIEPGPERLSSEVSFPVVEERSTLPETPVAERHAPQEPKDARELKDSQFHPTPERPTQEAKAPPREEAKAPPREEAKAEEAKAPPREAKVQPQEAKAPPQEAKEAKATQAPLDQREQPVLPSLQTGGPPQGVVVPGVPPFLRPVDGEGLQPDPDEVPGSQRGTNKRLGAHMVWNVLHRFRDPPELSAVEREKWSQVAFGSILALVGAALLMAMLASM